MKGGFGVDLEGEVPLMEGYTTMCMISLQHIISALLCMPYVFGLLPDFVGIPLVRWGAVMEVAWEWYDTVERIYMAFYVPGGAAVSPPSLCIILLAHLRTPVNNFE